MQINRTQNQPNFKAAHSIHYASPKFIADLEILLANNPPSSSLHKMGSLENADRKVLILNYPHGFEEAEKAFNKGLVKIQEQAIKAKEKFIHHIIFNLQRKPDAN